MNINRVLILYVFVCNIVYGQIQVDRNFKLELSKDKTKDSVLESSINFFLSEAKSGEFSDKYVDFKHIKKYSFFFNKLLGFSKSPDKTFNNPIVIKSYSVNDDKDVYITTISLTGTKNYQPFVYLIFEIKAMPYKNHYRFYSLFEERTSNFKTKTFKSVTYHYNGSIDESKAKNFLILKRSYQSLQEQRDYL